MLSSTQQTERGQALIFLTLVMIILIGFAAIALDGGNIYSEQRRAQSAADNAVLAAAQQVSKGITATSTISQAAFSTALANDYNNDKSDNWVSFHRPPIIGPYQGSQKYIQVVITRNVPTALAHLFYNGPWQVTVNAIAHGDITEPVMNGYAIASLVPGCNGASMIGIQGRGGGSAGGTVIRGGGTFVNQSCADALETSGGDTFHIEDGAFPIDIVGGYDGTCGTNFIPCPTTGKPAVVQDPIAASPAAVAPPCGAGRTLATELADTSDGAHTIRPGTYTGIDPGNYASEITMAPGIYCINGTAQNTAKFTSGNGGGIKGDGVLLYLVTAEANVDVSGQGAVDLRAPDVFNTPSCTSDTPPDICTYLGIVIYKTMGYDTCDQNDVEIKFSGQASMFIRGLIYAPYSLAQYGGQGNLTMTGQTLVGCVKFNGNGNIDITYDPDSTYAPPPLVVLDK